MKEFDEVSTWCKTNNIELVAVGPEDPLAGGLADHLTKEGLLALSDNNEMHT